MIIVPKPIFVNGYRAGLDTRLDSQTWPPRLRLAAIINRRPTTMNIKTGLKLQKAKNFARELHKDHTRLSGENVYNHTLRVQNHLKEAGVQDDNILIAALFHQALTFSNEVAPLI